MKIKTELLKELVNKSINGAGNNKLIPITQLMGIKRADDAIQLTTTDATNYLYVYGTLDTDVEDDIDVTVFAEQFSKLISKMTCKEIELTLKDNILEVVGNGTYTLELPLDENGELIEYPDPYASSYKDKDVKSEGTIKVSEIKTIIESVKPSLATTMELPSITNYFIGDNVVATDRYKIASFDNKMCDAEILISAQLMDLISLIDSDIKYHIADSYLVFEGDNISIFSKQSDDTSEYPIDAIEKLISEDFKSVCKVNKNEFIALLERIALFVGKYDDKAIKLDFTKNGIDVSNKSGKSVETIEYTDSKKHKNYKCTIDVDMLLSQLKAYAGDVVELHYNNDKSIKFVDGAITQIVALMVE